MSRRPGLYDTEIRVLAAILAFVTLLLCVLILQTLGDIIMKRLAIFAAVAVALSGCAGIPGTGGTNFDVNAFVNNPACAHDDELQGVTGAAGIPASLQFKVARHCPAAPAAPVVAPTP